MAHILILEDDTTLSAQMTELLRLEGYEVSAFASTGEALSFLKEHNVDLLVVDLFIKDRLGKLVYGGISLISQTRQIMRIKAPILAISGTFNSDIKLEAMQTSETVGANRMLAKPFHPDELTAIIGEMLTEYHQPHKDQAV